jgi:hypothetical protein
MALTMEARPEPISLWPFRMSENGMTLFSRARMGYLQQPPSREAPVAPCREHEAPHADGRKRYAVEDDGKGRNFLNRAILPNMNELLQIRESSIRRAQSAKVMRLDSVGFCTEESPG